MSTRLVLVSVLFFLFTSSAVQANLVASTPGEFSVSSAGAATYSVPIVVPPGTAGVEPKLSLNYSSQGRNGLMGVGWSIGGLSVIHRCPANLVKDGFIDGIDFDSNDRFCMDGQPLIAISGAYGASGTEYRTEINNFSKIKSYGSTGDGPSKFKVWTKSGEVMEYGYTSNSRINPPLANGSTQSDAICWLLNKVTDTVGNYMEVTYYENTSTGENYPTRIDYTGNAGLSPYNSVEFSYESRNDSRTRYLAGLKIESTKRLKKIKSKDGTSTVKEYKLAYSYSDRDGRSNISSVEECSSTNNCILPTEFEWHDAQNDWSSESSYVPKYPHTGTYSSSSHADYGVRYVDLNGDGLVDMLYNRWKSNGDHKKGAYLNTGSGWSSAPGFIPKYPHTGTYSSSTHADFGVRYVDLNGDGLVDMLYNRWKSNGDHKKGAYLNTGSGWSSAPGFIPKYPHTGTYSDETHADFGVRYVDLNGDGLVDMLYNRWKSNGDHKKGAYLNTGSGWSSAPGFIPKYPHTGHYSSTRHSDFGVRYVDLNGDGLVDMLYNRWKSNGDHKKGAYLNTGSGWSSAPGYIPKYPHTGHYSTERTDDFGVRYVDLNGDGLVDMLYYRWKTSGDHKKGAYLNTGSGWSSAPNYIPLYPHTSNYTGRNENLGVQYVDLNGDGLVDMLYSRWKSYDDPKKGAYLNTGSGWSTEPDYIPPYPHAGSYSDLTADYGVRYVDLNGDGLVDMLYNRWKSNGDHKKGAYINEGKFSLVKSVTSALDVSIEIDYAPTTDDSVYTKGSSAVFPEIDLQSPMFVVSESRTDNGIGGQNTLTYEYEGAKVHVQGRGLLGFAKRTVTDVDTDIVIETNYKQDFPYIGQVASSKTRVDGTLVSKETNTFAASGNATTGPAFPYISPSVSKTYDLDGGALLTTVTTTSSYDSYGNPKNIAVTTADVGIDTYTTTTVNTYTNNTSLWHLGRLTQSVVTKTGGAQSSPSRKSKFEYNSTTGLLKKEIIEPDNAAYKLTKTYAHDSFGNRISVTESGSGIATRTTSTSYDSNGQFPTSVTNAIGHNETRQYNDPYGNVTKLTGPNNLNTTWEYDSLGRKSREVRADGTETNISYAFCTGGSSCPSQVNGLASYKITTTTTGAATSIAYYDDVNRVILTESQSFDGSSVFVETEYDAQGRIDRRSNPYFGSGTTYWTEYTYDDLGRVTQESSPTTGTTTMSYSGFVTTSTNALNQNSTEMSNSIGQTLWTEDNNGKQLDFAYDAQGNLITVTDSAGNVTTNTYNLRGFKTQMIDPDMGTWTYNYNVLGELISQTDAKNQTVSMTYDKLGRLKTRTDPGSNEGTTTWIYDTATKGKGKLASVSHYGGYSRSHTYDNKGRPSSTTTVISGTSYTTSTTYDGFGRVDDVSYPGTSNFKVEHRYNARGYLEKVRNANNTSEVFYTAMAADQFGNITAQTTGSGAAAITTFRSYQQNSGRIHHIDSVVQDLQYTFNSIGNLTQRKDHDQSGLTENFTYDNLNRLKTANVAGAGSTSFNYDDLGNITYKSDVGNYHYAQTGNAGPHAVTSAGGNSYLYDKNGNQTSGDGKNITWSSFNKPTQITKGGSQSNFTYGPDRARYLQVTNSTTTTYIGGLYEKVEKPGSTEQKHFIRAGSQTIAIYTDRNGSTNDKTEYLHRDHLGSIDTITDENGAIVEKLSFDAFGKRRLSNWNNGLPTIVSNNTRGFTGHEMLDAVGLIHMNGRVYDPTLGRFISADPTMQFPKNMQNYNRYSYVLNNPLSYTDPSGFFLKKLAKKISRGIRSLGRSIRSGLKKIASNELLSAIVSIAVGFGATYALLKAGVYHVTAGAIGGFAGGFVGSGGDIKAAVIGGLSGAALAFVGGSEVFGTVGNALAPKRVIAHGVIGGARAEANGGKFGRGFLTGSINKLATGKIDQRFPDLSPSDEVIVAAVVGGTSSELTGGKFVNGAAASAFANLYNAQLSGLLKRQRIADNPNTEVFLRNDTDAQREGILNAVAPIVDTIIISAQIFGTGGFGLTVNIVFISGDLYKLSNGNEYGIAGLAGAVTTASVNKVCKCSGYFNNVVTNAGGSIVSSTANASFSANEAYINDYNRYKILRDNYL